MTAPTMRVSCGRRALHLAATLAGLFATQAFGQIGTAPSAKSQVLLNPMRAVEKVKLKAFVQQPLFVPARALPPPPAAYVASPPMAAPPPPPPMLQLIGLIEGTNAIAIVRDAGNPKTTILRGGDHLGIWNVVLLPNGLRLVNDKRGFDYTLFNKGHSPVPVDMTSVSAGTAALNDMSASVPK